MNGKALLRQVYIQHGREVLTRLLSDNCLACTVSREDLLDCSLNYVLRATPVDEQEVVTLSEPVGVGSLPETIYEKVGEWTFDKPFLTTLRDIQLVGPHALPLAPDGAYVLEAADGSSQRVADELVRIVATGLLPLRRDSADRTIETAVSLAGPWSREFFHWFADYLPQLRTVDRWYGDSGNAPPLLIPADPPDWLLASLDLLEVSERRRIPWSGGRTTVERLVVPSLPRHTESTAPESGYIQSPRALNWVADHLREAVGVEGRADVGQRLYVSRSEQPARDVVNEGELVGILDKYGFELVRPERWSLAEQIATFSRAEAVCGPHGAGLVNLIYAPSNAILLELFGERTNPCFYAIAAGTGRRYAAHHATPEGDDLRVDPDRLAELLAMVDDWPCQSTDSK